VYLVDDGSTDGTAAAVRESFPSVKIIEGNGDLFWCRGMRLAWEHAVKESPDFYLWLNDDTVLFDEALESLLVTWCESNPKTIVVGSCCDPSTGELTYGGQLRVSGNPAVLKPVQPQDTPKLCDTFQSNVLLVSREVFECVGMIDKFGHAIGDTDYGYRATKTGCACLVAPGFLASCAANTSPSYRTQGRSRIERWRLLNSRKGLPFGDWLRFMNRHGGMGWPFYWIRPYLRVLFNR
jgi:GT2 family glycosyltransferase